MVKSLFISKVRFSFGSLINQFRTVGKENHLNLSLNQTLQGQIRGAPWARAPRPQKMRPQHQNSTKLRP